MHPYLSKLNMQEHPRTIKIQIKLNSHKKKYFCFQWTAHWKVYITDFKARQLIPTQGILFLIH